MRHHGACQGKTLSGLQAWVCTAAARSTLSRVAPSKWFRPLILFSSSPSPRGNTKEPCPCSSPDSCTLYRSSVGNSASQSLTECGCRREAARIRKKSRTTPEGGLRYSCCGLRAWAAPLRDVRSAMRTCRCSGSTLAEQGCGTFLARHSSPTTRHSSQVCSRFVFLGALPLEGLTRFVLGLFFDAAQF